MTDPTQPTQTRYPWRATARTAIALIIALASLLPTIALAGGLETEQWVAQLILVCAAITRVMAIPAVNELLARFGLSAEPMS